MAANKRRLTEPMIERLRPPRTGRLEIGDEVCPGLVLRVTPRGAKSFSVIYKVAGEGGVSPSGRLLTGRQHRITLGPWPRLKLKKARDDARALLGTVTEGRDPRPERREQNLIRHTNTVEAVSKRMIELAKGQIDTWQKIEQTLSAHVWPDLGHRPIRDVRRADVLALLDDLVAQGRVGTAREVRKHLSRLLNFAVERELIPASPIARLRLRALEREERERALTDEEVRALWTATARLGYPFGPATRLLLLTGQRKSDWSMARRSEIDATDRLLSIPAERYKSRRGHVVPLPEPAWAIIEGLPVHAGNDYYLLSSRAGARPISGWSKAKPRLDKLMLAALREDEDEATLAPFVIHDLRRTCETRLARLGWRQEVRDAVLGHAKPGLQKTYNKHDYMDERRAALAAYAEHIMGVVA